MLASGFMLGAIAPNPIMIAPFAILLGLIAIGPLFFPDWWGRHYPKVALSLGALSIAYYAGALHNLSQIGHTAHEYASFIALVGSLFVVSGGIHVGVKGQSTPAENVLFLLIGAVLANFLGTTGAAMLLIRPWIRMNRFRITGHHIVFFIFIVANVGGCLTPIGDPPLFLGYLKGVPFWWVAQKCWLPWLVGVIALAAIFFVIDARNYRQVPASVRENISEPPDSFRIEGGLNLVLLLALLGAVFIQHPTFLREAIMIGVSLVSLKFTPKHIHESNHFNLHPIQEVAILFAGIFATMMPALDWLQIHAGQLGTTSPAFFFWGSGTLSAVLDNAPTYLSFLSALCGKFVPAADVDSLQAMLQSGTGLAANAPASLKATYDMLTAHFGTKLGAGTITGDEIRVAWLLAHAQFHPYLAAISVGSVFFGAATYIGNGPNFMVKAIADHAKIHTPSFPAYIGRYTIPFFLPMLILVWWLFFRS